MTTNTEPDLQQKLRAFQSQVETLKKELAESQQKLQRIQTNVAPWELRLLFAILVLGTIVWLTAVRFSSIEVRSWLDLTFVGLILCAWCSTSWAAFWYTRTLR